MLPFAVYCWHYLTEGWEARNAQLIRLAGRRPDTNCAGSGVYELVWYVATVPEAEDLRDLLRVIPGVTTEADWGLAQRKN